jgi:hypothetical protein
MSGAIPPRPDTPSWRGAQLKHRGYLERTHFLTLYTHLNVSNMPGNTARNKFKKLSLMLSHGSECHAFQNETISRSYTSTPSIRLYGVVLG